MQNMQNKVSNIKTKDTSRVASVTSSSSALVALSPVIQNVSDLYKTNEASINSNCNEINFQDLDTKFGFEFKFKDIITKKIDKQSIRCATNFLLKVNKSIFETALRSDKKYY